MQIIFAIGLHLRLNSKAVLLPVLDFLHKLEIVNETLVVAYCHEHFVADQLFGVEAVPQFLLSVTRWTPSGSRTQTGIAPLMKQKLGRKKNEENHYVSAFS